MDNQINAPLLDWPYYFHVKTTEERRHSLLYTTLELAQTKTFVQEEIKKRDEQLINLKDILTETIKERDEALEKCRLLVQKHMTPPLSGTSSIENEQVQLQQKLGSKKSVSSSDCCEKSIMNPPQSQEVSGTESTDPLFTDKPLPEKGKLLQAVLKAGPLLQTLLLAGPLPQWHHPPPLLKTFEIPPVTIHSPVVNNGCWKFNRKRVSTDGKYPETKYQKVLLH